MKKKIINAIKNNNLYGFVAENYYDMTKDELVSLVLELSYTLYQIELKSKSLVSEEDLKEIKKEFIEELEERLYDDEEE